MRRHVTVTLAALSNAVLGLLAVPPLAVLMSLLAYAAHSPTSSLTNHTYATIAGRPPPIEIDGDEAGVALVLLVVAAALLGGAFVATNTWLLGRLPGARRAGWVAAAMLTLLPFACFVGYWWLRSAPR
ncbi:hypothetical protein AB0A95_15975 [Micromonospora sp. NPDC049230]|uniref:hypothetical protein n=1 Tax=Micromonospora sp. NPDC049230 TaxID=3155502 RepID=UPI0033FE0C5D